MDITKARKLLGKDSESLSDERITSDIETAQFLSDIIIDSYLKMSAQERMKYNKSSKNKK